MFHTFETRTSQTDQQTEGPTGEHISLSYESATTKEQYGSAGWGLRGQFVPKPVLFYKLLRFA